MKANLNVPTKCAIEMEQPNEKYSLRQRQKRSTRNTTKQTENSTKNDQTEASIGGGVDATAGAATAAATAVDPSMDTSSASGRSTQQTKSSKKSAAKSKAKQKAAPLSKYRRKTANARERIRMREINSAFEHLRQCVPTSFCESNPANTNEKLTKITTLRMAMKYISTLTNMLNSSDMTMGDDTTELLASIMTKTCNQMPMDNAFINNNNDGVTINNNNKSMKSIEMETKAMVSATAAAAAVSNKGKAKGKSKKATTATANKAISKRKSTKTKAATTKATTTNKTNITIDHNLAAIKSQIYESIPANTMNTLCLTPPLSSTDSPLDLGLMLESDGESLHLSEPCLSPPLSSTSTPSNQKQFMSTTVTPPASMTMSNGLDIGLFLDSDTDSLHFPEPCLSPLDGGFDAFSPFSDLLNPSGFPEHSSLDIYLT